MSIENTNTNPVEVNPQASVNEGTVANDNHEQASQRIIKREQEKVAALELKIAALEAQNAAKENAKVASEPNKTNNNDELISTVRTLTESFNAMKAKQDSKEKSIANQALSNKLLDESFKSAGITGTKEEREYILNSINGITGFHDSAEAVKKQVFNSLVRDVSPKSYGIDLPLNKLELEKRDAKKATFDKEVEFLCQGLKPKKR